AAEDPARRRARHRVDAGGGEAHLGGVPRAPRPGPGPRGALQAVRRGGPVRLRVGPAGAGRPAARRGGRPGPALAVRGAAAPAPHRGAHDAARPRALPRERRRPLVPRRVGGARGRPAPGAVRVGSRRRLQHPPVLPRVPVRPGRDHRGPDPRAAAAGAVPHRVRARHVAREPRARAPRRGDLMTTTTDTATLPGTDRDAPGDDAGARPHPRTAGLPDVPAPRDRDVRWELAAALRAFARAGFEFGSNGHVSARAPEAPGHYWVNPFGLSISTVTPSDLVLVGPDGAVVDARPSAVINGFAGNLRLHQEVEDAAVVVHLHTPSGFAWSSLGRPLEAVTTDAALIARLQGLT